MLGYMYTVTIITPKMTGGSGTLPLVVGGAGIATRYWGVLDGLIGGPMAALGGAAGMAAYTTNYVDSVCKAP